MGYKGYRKKQLPAEFNTVVNTDTAAVNVLQGAVRDNSPLEISAEKFHKQKEEKRKKFSEMRREEKLRKCKKVIEEPSKFDLSDFEE